MTTLGDFLGYALVIFVVTFMVCRIITGLYKLFIRYVD